MATIFVSMAAEVVLITPTGSRPESFDICIKLVERQTLKGWHWIVVDDGATPIPDNSGLASLVANGNCTHLRPTPVWSGTNTHKRNLQTALDCCHAEWIAFIEDDDWYHPEYLERSLNKAKEGYRLVGEANANYYHLPSRSYRAMGNRSHASLCQTVMHRSLLPSLLEILATNESCIDILLWRNAWKAYEAFLFPTSTHSVGIKGMPGRPGLGIGHRPGSHWKTDMNSSVLRDLIGADVELYENYLGGADA